ncbi:MAG: HhH-GPD family protein [Thermoplasmataceae archaeon]
MEPALQLIEWWRENGRDFPWRKENDPYKILIAEILLHRTRAQNVVPVYIRFINIFGSVRDAAKANEEDIRRILKPLGLTWRVEKLIETFRLIAREFHGNIPLEKDALLKLPGIGDYISSAFRTFYGGSSDPLIDTNTVRVICRVFGMQMKDSTRRSGEVRRLYLELLDGANPKAFGYSMLDLANAICVPKVPRCTLCPVGTHCETGMYVLNKILNNDNMEIR